MSLISRLFGKGEETTEMLCPHCERAMDAAHDADGCARKRMSRRFFFGTMAGAAAAIALPPVLVAAAPSIVAPDLLMSCSYFGTFMVTICKPHPLGQYSDVQAYIAEKYQARPVLYPRGRR